MHAFEDKIHTKLEEEAQISRIEEEENRIKLAFEDQELQLKKGITSIQVKDPSPTKYS